MTGSDVLGKECHLVSTRCCHMSSMWQCPVAGSGRELKSPREGSQQFPTQTTRGPGVLQSSGSLVGQRTRLNGIRDKLGLADSLIVLT